MRSKLSAGVVVTVCLLAAACAPYFSQGSVLNVAAVARDCSVASDPANSGGTVPVMTDMIWPSFIVTPFMLPISAVTSSAVRTIARCFRAVRFSLRPRWADAQRTPARALKAARALERLRRDAAAE